MTTNRQNRPYRPSVVLSTRRLAGAIGVSESSIKRWVDDGTLPARRTAGGHRRIPLADAIRFVRAARLPVVRPQYLGLTEVDRARHPVGGDSDGARLARWLLAGAAGEAQGLLVERYLRGDSIASIVDSHVREAFATIGELWRHDESGIFLEHRATDLCVQALHGLRSLVAPPSPGALRALGGAAPGDPYVLPSLAVATALADVGLHASNLGPDVPLATLARAIEQEGVSIAWLSVSVANDPARLARDLNDLARRLGRRGVTIVVGGRAATGLPLVPSPSLHVVATLGELVAFVLGMGRGQRPGRQ